MPLPPPQHFESGYGPGIVHINVKTGMKTSGKFPTNKYRQIPNASTLPQNRSSSNLRSKLPPIIRQSPLPSPPLELSPSLGLYLQGGSLMHLGLVLKMDEHKNTSIKTI